MENTTIISYCSSDSDALLSLTESRSKYMLPFGGRFRIVDFTIRNSISSGIRSTIIYSNREDELEDYVENYGPFRYHSFPPIKVVTREYSDIMFCYNLIMDTNTAYYIIYNGDNPSIIDFEEIIKEYKRKRSNSVLFKIMISGRTKMAYRILVTRQKDLLDVINLAIDENRTSPNIFEMIINIMINKGMKEAETNAHYWPINNIPDYYAMNMEILKNPELFSLVFKKSSIKSFIKGDDHALVGINARIAYSFISDSCKIFGTALNSIIFPGVEIGEKTIVKDSIVLPYTKIGLGSNLIRTIIDESTDMYDKMDYLNIGNNCYIGSENDQIKNNDFSKSLYRSITLIGKNCNLPNGARIGGACYIASGKGEEYFQKTKYLNDGLSLVE